MKGLHASFYLSESGIYKITLELKSEGKQNSPFLTWNSIDFKKGTNKNETRFCDSISAWVDQYNLGKEPKISLPLYWEGVSSFTQAVLKKLQNIPFGISTSYSLLAQQINSINAARAVGGACGRNPFLLIVPCHRVLTSVGSLGGFSAGLEIKKELLAFEQIRLTKQHLI